jgi:hypothetical protein
MNAFFEQLRVERNVEGFLSELMIIQLTFLEYTLYRCDNLMIFLELNSTKRWAQ